MYLVTIHIGDSTYLYNFIKLNCEHNHLYLIGDDDNKHYQEEFDNFTHIDCGLLHYGFVDYLNGYKDPNIHNMENNSHDLNVIKKSYLRWFYMYNFMTLMNINKLFHIDSDCIILKNLDEINSISDNVALSVCNNYDNEMRMSSAIHNAMLTKEFVKSFIDLFHDVFISKQKYNLIESKLEYHKNNPGYICDMTLTYILINTSHTQTQDLKSPIQSVVFNHNLLTGEGYLSKNQYEMQQMLQIYYKNNNLFIYDLINKEYHNLASLHFQGRSKYFLINYNEFNESFKKL